MIYSVWDYDKKKYDYYDGASLPPPAVGSFRKPSASPGKIGFSPEDLAAEVPSGARYLGEGDDPQGVIGKKSFSLSSFGKNNLYMVMGGIAAGLTLGWWYWKKRR